MRIPKKGLSYIVLAVLVLGILPFATAEILISQTSSNYNKGDPFNVSISIIPGQTGNDFVSANMICGENTIDLFRSPLSLTKGETKVIPLQITLTDDIIGSSMGSCKITSSYGGETEQSQLFDISRTVQVSISVNGMQFNPGEPVSITGSAIKNNGKPLTGFIEFSVESLDFSFSGQVNDGKFALNFSLPENSKSGNYEMIAHVYDRDGKGNLQNEGTSTALIKIKQIPKTLEIAINSQTFLPPNELIYTILVHDQAGDPYTDDISASIILPDKTVLLKKLVKSDIANSLQIEANNSPGYWTIKANLGSLESIKQFTIEELKTASFQLENGSLIVTNTGNVIYDKPVEVVIGGKTEVKDLTLAVGQSKKFKLFAPDGEYDVEINDGSSRQQLGRSFLTGKAVSVSDSLSIPLDIKLSNWFLWIWILVIVALLILVIYFYLKMRNQSYTGSIPKASAPMKMVRSMAPPSTMPPKKMSLDPGIMDQGERQEATVISLNIKNREALKQGGAIPLAALEKALHKAKTNGARVYLHDDYRHAIFVPRMTKEKDNTLRAAKIAQDMAALIKEANTKAATQLEYGIGIHVGDLIIESMGDKFKFISSGNTLTNAKRLARGAKNEILISDEMHRKTSATVKVDRVPNLNAWKITRIVDRSDHEEFISGFMTRQKKDNFSQKMKSGSDNRPYSSTNRPFTPSQNNSSGRYSSQANATKQRAHNGFFQQKPSNDNGQSDQASQDDTDSSNSPPSKGPFFKPEDDKE